ncbi:hypothetical protein [Euzebya sp.]|uniref:hypothetical protein n=1 Tax=Euzebya sp. TaxID=1971409 RepID=UPI00351869E2
MPDLRELLHDAVPSGEPTFDAADVRDRVRAVERRHRRTVVGVAAAVVLLVAVGIGTTITTDRTAFVDTVPSAGWPSSVTFAGAQVEVTVGAEPGDLVGYVEPGDTITAVGASTDVDGRVSLWFTCGGGEAVRLREVYDPPTPPALPVAALAEAATQLTSSNGCEPEPPTKTPDVQLDGGIGLVGLARAIDRAGMTACCATVPLVPMADRPGVSDGGIGTFRAAEGSVAWAVEDGGDEPLRFTADFHSWVPTDLVAPEFLPLAGGRVAWDPARGVVAATCGMATVQARMGQEELPRWEAFLDSIDCTPSPPEGLGPTFDLVSLLSDLGVEPVATPAADATVAAAEVVVDGQTLVIRSGGMGQVGLPQSAMEDLPRTVGTFVGTGDAWPTGSTTTPVGGAFTVCTITHAVFAFTEPGVDLAVDLAERIRAHPGCATVGLPEGAPPMPAAPPPAEVTTPGPEEEVSTTVADDVIQASSSPAVRA